MPERRFDHLRELEALGLAPPDQETMHFLWQIVDEGVLGASRHVDLGNQLILHLIESGSEGVERARLAAAFIARTRGQDTPVIGNSLDILLAGIESLTVDEQRAMLRSRINAWSMASKARKSALVDAAVRHLSETCRVMAFDYSSTVASNLIELAKNRSELLVIVPESRAIAGGARFLEELLPQGLNVNFIPDAAIEHGLELSDAALFGVETLRADGSFLNTIGSRMIARLAGTMGVEVYGATDLMKLDRRSYGGHRPEPAIRSYDKVLTAALEIQGIENVNTSAPELEVIPPILTTGFMTEYGIVPPAAIWTLGREKFCLGEQT